MKVPLFDSVDGKKKTNIQMFSSLGTGSPSVFIEENCRLIVLIHNRRMDIIALALQEIIIPTEIRHHIISCNEFSLCLASGIQSLLDRI